MQDNTDLIADLRLNHEYCTKEVILQAADAIEAAQAEIERLTGLAGGYANENMRLMAEIEAVRKANIDCVEHFNALMKDYTDLQKELVEIEEREYVKQLIEGR